MTADIVQRHYQRGLEGALLDALATVPELGSDELAAYDEFHSRGAEATSELAALLGLRPGQHVLDVGAGLGGPARYLARECDVRVTAIDLTADYIRLARRLTACAGLEDRIAFHQGNILSAPFESDSFDAAWVQHVAMNVADKPRMFAEVRRVLVAGGVLAVHEVVAPGGHPLRYPVPWARTPSSNFIARPARLRAVIENAGFELRRWIDTSAQARAWCRAMADQAPDEASRLGLHVLLGDDCDEMIDNFAHNLDEGRLGVVMALFVKAG